MINLTLLHNGPKLLVNRAVKWVDLGQVLGQQRIKISNTLNLRVVKSSSKVPIKLYITLRTVTKISKELLLELF